MDPASNRRDVPRGAERASRAPRAAVLGRPYRPRAAGTVADAWAAVAQPEPLSGHLPRRPWWSCRSCQAEWPCPVARELIIAGGLPGNRLGIYMADWMAAAAAELPRVTPGALWDRFLGWTRRPTP